MLERGLLYLSSRQNEFYIFSMLSINKKHENGDDIHIYYIFIGILFSIHVLTLKLKKKTHRVVRRNII